MIFVMLPGAEWPGTGGTLYAEFAKGGWQHPSCPPKLAEAAKEDAKKADCLPCHEVGNLNEISWRMKGL